MASIEELFAQMEGDSVYTDAHDVILVDPVARTLDIPDTELGDIRAERKYFGIPCVVGNNIDVTACTVHINYKNAAGEDGCFKVSSLKSDGNVAIFSWELSSKVVKAIGDVKFIICVCNEVDGEVQNEWHTTLATGKVLEGMARNTDTIEGDSDPDSGMSVSAALGTAILNSMVLS